MKVGIKFVLPEGIPPGHEQDIFEAVAKFANDTAGDTPGHLCGAQAVVAGLMIAVAALMEDGENSDDELKEKYEYARDLLGHLLSHSTAHVLADGGDTEH